MTNPIVEELWDRIDENLIEHGEAAAGAARTAVQARNDTVAAAETAAGEAAAGVTTRLESLTTRSESASSRAVAAAATAAQDTVNATEELLTGHVADAESAAYRAEAAAEEAEAGVRDDTVGRRHLTPELRDEVDGMATTEAVDSALDGKADVEHLHTADDFETSATTSALGDNANSGKLVKTDGLGNVHSFSDPKSYSHLTRKQYVDGQVETRATPDTVSSMISNAVAGLVGSAPDALDTVYEIAAYLVDDEVAGGLIEQLAQKADKGHTHTASEVGARPADWVPTAQEVGSRPDTWTPTASDVGARPDDWTPTANDVGAATPDYVDSRVREVTGDDWPSSPVPGVIYWQGE